LIIYKRRSEGTPKKKKSLIFAVFYIIILQVSVYAAVMELADVMDSTSAARPDLFDVPLIDLQRPIFDSKPLF